MNIQIHQQLANIFQSLSDLNVPELDEVMQQVLLLRRKKNKAVLSELETDLLRKINVGIPAVIQRRYNYLIKRKTKEIITEVELDELIELTAYMESRTAQRLEYLIELAKLRNITLDEVRMQLQINPDLHVA